MNFQDYFSNAIILYAIMISFLRKRHLMKSAKYFSLKYDTKGPILKIKFFLRNHLRLIKPVMKNINPKTVRIFINSYSSKLKKILEMMIYLNQMKLSESG